MPELVQFGINCTRDVLKICKIGQAAGASTILEIFQDYRYY